MGGFCFAFAVSVIVYYALSFSYDSLGPDDAFALSVSVTEKGA